MIEPINPIVAGTSILVVDDEPANLSLLTDMLSNVGYKVYVAPSGKLALSSVSLNSPDLILLDILMPGLDGYEVCSQLKAEAKTSQIPVLFISALDAPVDKIRAFDVGGSDYISKPFHDQEVLARVKAHLSQYRVHEKLEHQVAIRTAEFEHERKKVERLNVILQDDILALREANQIIEESEHRYRVLMEAAPDALIVVDAVGEIELFNKSASSLFGYSENELIGLSAETLLPAQFAKHEVGFCQFVSDKSSAVAKAALMLTGQKKSGELFSVDVSVSPIETERGLRFIADIRDLTERQQLEQQVRHSQKMEVIGHLTAGVAHDFNNILTSILGFTSLAMMLKDKATNEKLEAYLREINYSGERARELVAQMLTFSRIEKPNDQESIELVPVIKGALDMLRPMMPSTIILSHNLETAIPAVFADSIQINQIIMNLCVNASDAIAGHGKIDLTARTARGDHGQCSSCHQTISGDYVEVVVTDSGSGIDDEALQRIFDPFFTTKEVGKGTGMGLSIVHGIMHSHQGHVRVESVPGQGSAFHLFLPIAETDTQPLEVEHDSGLDLIDGKGRHILVVDDEEVIALFLQEYLEMQGYKVSSFSDSKAALEAYRNAAHDFDLVITDQTMPGITGRELATEMLEIRNDLPIILCTGYDAMQESEGIQQFGISAVIQKPVDCKGLVVKIEKLLSEGGRCNGAMLLSL